jgi:hypothetical protein
MKLALVVTTEGNAFEIGTSIDEAAQLEEHAGGLVEPVMLSNSLIMWCNEEGKIRELPRNKMASIAWEMFCGKNDYIAGNVIFTGGVDIEGELESLDESRLELLRGILALSELGELV